MRASRSWASTAQLAHPLPGWGRVRLVVIQMLQWDVQVLICAHGKVFEVQDEDARTEIQLALDLTDSLAITA